MSRIAIFFHGVFFLNGQFAPHAFNVIQSIMGAMQESGLTDTADEIYCCTNGGEESVPFAETVYPEKAVKIYHGTECRTEIRSVMEMQKRMAGRKGWKVFYAHAKGASHDPGEKMITNWRGCMAHHLISNWLIATNSLNAGFDASGCHWLKEQVDGTMFLFGGNWFWVTSDFLNTLAPIENNARLPHMGGIDAAQSRFEAEVIWNTGPRLPKVRDFHQSWPFECPER